MKIDEVVYKLPPLPSSGAIVVMRQITGEDELAAAQEVGAVEGPAANVLHTYALVARALVSIDGIDFDRSTVTGVGVRNRFDPRDWQALNRAFNRIHVPEEKALKSFLDGIVVGTR